MNTGITTRNILEFDFDHVYQNIEGKISDKNKKIAEQLLDQLKKDNLIDEFWLVGSDGNDGLSIRWVSDHNIFCEIWDEKIVISQVPIYSKNHNDVINFEFTKDDIKGVSDKINSLLKLNKI
jgi:hypothetical protein